MRTTTTPTRMRRMAAGRRGDGLEDEEGQSEGSIGYVRDAQARTVQSRSRFAQHIFPHA